MHAAIEQKVWTREECDALVEAGIIDPQCYELIEGELIKKVSQNYPHMRVVFRVCKWLRPIFGDGVVQEPSIHLASADTPYSDPEPDVVVLTRPFDELGRKANPDEILLVVEVANTSLLLDPTRKAALYARAGIPDYWILDINARRIVVHRDPAGGVYQSIHAISENEPIAPLASPSALVRATDFL